MSSLGLILVNTLVCAALPLIVAAIAVRIDPRHFAQGGLLRTHPAEIAFYRRILHIRRWKHLLPDGEPWVGGRFHRKHLAARNPAYFQQLLIETRRGEAAHWIILSCFPLVFLWNPPWARLAIALYAVTANVPCILVQRYNRYVIEHLLSPRFSRNTR